MTLNHSRKIIFWLGIIVVIYIFLFAIWHLDFSNNKKPEWGISFSQAYAEFLGLDWQRSYKNILQDLKPKYIRLSADWDKVEPEAGKFNFTDLDWQVAEAKKADAKVVMVIGARTPRWPECHFPVWQKDGVNQQDVFNLLTQEVNHYKGESSIYMWQVENEPLLNLFGECPRANRNLLKQEIALVRSLDSRPIMVTDSGELSLWLRSAGLGDYLGTTMYRRVWNPLVGYWSYRWLIPPAWYRLRASLNFLPASRLIVSELQAEPWLPSGSAWDVSLTEQQESFSVQHFKEYTDFAAEVGFSPVFLWGAEYWQWRRGQGDSSLWNFAQQLFLEY